MLKVFMTVYANNSGGVTSDGGARANKSDLKREQNRGLGASAAKSALNALPRTANRGLGRKSGRRGARK